MLASVFFNGILIEANRANNQNRLYDLQVEVCTIDLIRLFEVDKL